MSDTDDSNFDPNRTLRDPRRSSGSAPTPDVEGTLEMKRTRQVQDLEATLKRKQEGSAAPGTDESAEPAVFEMVCLSGQARGRRFPLRGDECVLGSMDGCDVHLPEASTIHAKLERQGEAVEITNVGPDGSVVLSGGRAPSQALLKSGDLLKVNGVVLRFARIGDVFSAEYSENAFEASTLGRLFGSSGGKEKRLYWVIAILVLVVVALLLAPPIESPKPVATKAGPSAADAAREKEVQSLLSSGEVLFNEGKLFAPPDRPDETSAFGKFNEALALDPGNATALAFLKRIDEERDKQRRAREDEEKRRIAAEQAGRDRAVKELAGKVDAILAEGDKLFKEGKVAEPAGRNALVRYRDALKVDPSSMTAKGRVDRVIAHYVERGDDARDKNDPWAAIENYRKASRVTEGRDADIEARVRDTEARLRSTLSPGSAKVVMYKDESGRLFVLDDPDKVPARYKDRSVTVEPQASPRQ